MLPLARIPPVAAPPNPTWPVPGPGVSHLAGLDPQGEQRGNLRAARTGVWHSKAGLGAVDLGGILQRPTSWGCLGTRASSW